MNQKQFESNINKAEKAFTATVGACFVFFKHNTDKTDSEILAILQTATAKVVEDLVWL